MSKFFSLFSERGLVSSGLFKKLELLDNPVFLFGVSNGVFKVELMSSAFIGVLNHLNYQFVH